MLKNFLLLIKVSRPVTSWPSGLLLFAIGLHVAQADLTPLVFVNILLLPLFAVMAFGLNDIYDYKTDRLSDRKASLLEGVVLEPKHHRLVKQAAAFSAALLIAFSAATQNLTHSIATIVLIALAHAYSAPPLRLKEKPVADSLSNAVAAMAVMLLGFSYNGTIADFPLKLVYASLAVAALHSLGAAMDYTADKMAGVTTIATFFGKRFAAAFSFVIIGAILLFSGIRSAALNLYLWLWLVISGAAFIYPNEKLVRKLVVCSFFFAVAAVLLFLYQQFYK